MNFWTDKEDLGGFEFKTSEEAEKYFSEKYADYICENESPRNGETFSETMTICLYDGENDIILEEKEVTLEYVHYHGDYAEHFSQSDYI